MKCLLEKKLFLTTTSSGFRGEKKEKHFTNFSLKTCPTVQIQESIWSSDLPLHANGWTTGLS